MKHKGSHLFLRFHAIVALAATLCSLPAVSNGQQTGGHDGQPVIATGATTSTDSRWSTMKFVMPYAAQSIRIYF